MKTRQWITAGTVALALGYQSASAATIFEDVFDTENGAVGVLNYGSLANWNVSDGTVDLIGNGFFDFQPGNGLYLDMDGSTADAGKITTKSAFNFVPGGTYTLTFDLAGNLRSQGKDQVHLKMGTLIDVILELDQNAIFATQTHIFAPSVAETADLSFEGLGGDYFGLLLDNVKLTVVRDGVNVPDAGGTLGLFSMGLMGILPLARRIAQKLS